jgi:hypothetical protein
MLTSSLRAGLAAWSVAVAAPAVADPASASERCTFHPNAMVADLGLHVVNGGVQRTVSCHLVVQGSAGLYVPWMVNGNVLGLGGGDRPPDGVWDVFGFVVRVRPFLFPLGKAPVGFWISPSLQAGFVRGATVTGESLAGFASAYGLSLGGTFPIGSHVLVGVGAGAQLQFAVFRSNTDKPGFALPGPTVDLNLGYRF